MLEARLEQANILKKVPMHYPCTRLLPTVVTHDQARAEC